MDKRKQLTKILLFVFLAIFPLGQLISINLGGGLRVQPIDLIAVSSIFLFDIKDLKQKWLQMVLFPLFFSFIFSLSLFKLPQTFIGGLYLIRLLGYISFFICIRKSVDKSDAKTLLYSLIGITVFSVAFGWAQYLYLPDLRTLKFFGWDDHLYRMVGSFLDPAFIGIIFVLGSFVSLSLFYSLKKNVFLYLFVFIGFSLTFTYSRSSYLAFIIGITIISGFQKRFKLLLIILICFLGFLAFLPRPSSEGVKLERTESILARFENYKESASLIKLSPVFGLGYDNVCIAKAKYLQNDSLGSHSCSGVDSSFLYILIAVGIVGFLLFLGVAWEFLTHLELTSWSNQLLLASLVALFVHSQFSNSLFYPWVMGWFAVLRASTLRGKFNGK